MTPNEFAAQHKQYVVTENQPTPYTNNTSSNCKAKVNKNFLAPFVIRIIIIVRLK